MHIGLHIAIMQDALERMQSGDVVDQKLEPKGKKRSSDKVEDTELPQPKKRRKAGRSPVSTDVHDAVSHFFSNYDVVGSLIF